MITQKVMSVKTDKQVVKNKETRQEMNDKMFYDRQEQRNIEWQNVFWYTENVKDQWQMSLDGQK